MGYWNTAYLRFSGSADVIWLNVSLVPINCWTIRWQRIKTLLHDLKQLGLCSPGLHSVFDCKRKYTSQPRLKLQIKIWLESLFQALSQPCTLWEFWITAPGRVPLTLCGSQTIKNKTFLNSVSSHIIFSPLECFPLTVKSPSIFWEGLAQMSPPVGWSWPLPA